MLHKQLIRFDPSYKLRIMLTIPAELVESVAGYLDPADLLSFRQICRDVNAKTIREVARSLFETKTCLLTYLESMDALEQILRHHTFDKALKTIRCSLQITLVESCSWAASLTRILSLAKHACPCGSIGIEFYNHYEPRRPKPLALRKLKQAYPSYPRIDAKSWNTIIDAIVTAGCPLSSFTSSVDGVAHNMPLSLINFPGPRGHNIDFRAVFGRVEELNLALTMTSSFGQKPLSAKDIQRFAQMLMDARNTVKVLRLRCAFGERKRSISNFFDVLAQAGHLPQLNELRLTDFSVRVETLVSFVRRHRRTLRRLEVYGFDPDDLDRYDDYSSVFGDPFDESVEGQLEAHVRSSVDGLDCRVDFKYQGQGPC